MNAGLGFPLRNHLGANRVAIVFGLYPYRMIVVTGGIGFGFRGFFLVTPATPARARAFLVLGTVTLHMGAASKTHHNEYQATKNQYLDNRIRIHIRILSFEGAPFPFL